jgi:phosphatidyl-myo-inositol alpha-mannosyltransferase
MRVAQICPYSLSVPGGVQGQVLGLARALRSMGHEARVLAPCDGPPPDPMVTPLGMSIPMSSNGSVAPIAPDPACALRTIHALRNEGFDILHLHEPLVPGPTFTALLVSDIPMIGTFHAAGNKTGYKVMWLTRRMAKKMKMRTAVSQDAATTAQNNVQGHYDILYNGIEIERIAGVEPWEKTGPTIFFVGRHDPRKGLTTLLDAMKALPNDTTLWIAGHGPQTATLRESTKNDHRIHWLGRISDSEKSARLRAADVFCAPATEGESFGIVLLEAMAAGTPIVCSDIAGYRNVVSADNAVLVKPGDAVGLADCLSTVINDVELAARLRTNGSLRADEFSMTGLARRYLNIYSEVLHNSAFIG